MAGPTSVYLSDATLKKLDRLVEKQATADVRDGLRGRDVCNRSKFISRLIDRCAEDDMPLDREAIRYAVVDLAKSYGAAKVSLFGSYARGDQRPDSDVDILLDKGSIKGMQVLEFQEALSSRLGCPVDVVTTAGASERFLKKANRDAVVLYEAA